MALKLQVFSGALVKPGKTSTSSTPRVVIKREYCQDMLQAIEEELDSPCTKEMAAFDRFVQFLESHSYQVIVFDTAPTGHTLRLLDLPFDYAKQVETMVAAAPGQAVKETSQVRIRNIINILHDPERVVFNLVLYPESTPILESYRAMKELESAGIKTQMIVVNMILPEVVCVNGFFRSRRNMQHLMASSRTTYWERPWPLSKHPRHPHYGKSKALFFSPMSLLLRRLRRRQTNTR